MSAETRADCRHAASMVAGWAIAGALFWWALS